MYCAIFVLGVVLLFINIVCADPPKPVFPEQFSANVSTIENPTEVGELYYDGKAKHRTLNMPMLLVTGREIFYSNEDHWYIQIGDGCRLIPNAKFSPMWSFMGAAHFTGNETIDGMSLQVWTFAQNVTKHLSILNQVWTDGISPYKYVMEIDGHSVQFSSFLFRSFTPQVYPKAIAGGPFDIPHNCFVPPPLCNMTITEPPPVDLPAGWQVLTAYVFHPHAYFDVRGQNVADLTGDVAFVCIDIQRAGGSNVFGNDGYDVISKYEIEVDTRWGQYQICNIYPLSKSVCLGAETFHVGREYMGGVGHNFPLQGQCTPNTDIGSWFSLPPAGMCNDTEVDSNDGNGNSDRISHTGCTWRIRRRIKTIDATCLTDKSNPFVDSCKFNISDPSHFNLSMNFHESKIIFSQAFDSEDKSKNGCPPSIYTPKDCDTWVDPITGKCMVSAYKYINNSKKKKNVSYSKRELVLMAVPAVIISAFVCMEYYKNKKRYQGVDYRKYSTTKDLNVSLNGIQDA